MFASSRMGRQRRSALYVLRKTFDSERVNVIMTASIIDYQQDPQTPLFVRLKELTESLKHIFPDQPKPTDWIDELEEERLEQMVERMKG